MVTKKDQLKAKLSAEVQPVLDVTRAALSKIYDPQTYFNISSYDLESLSTFSDSAEAYLFTHGELIKGLDWYLLKQLFWIRGIQQVYSKYADRDQMTLWTD